MSNKSLILTGKRKRAAVSYAEPDDDLELQGDEDQNHLLAPADLTESDADDDDDDDDDDETFGARRKVSPTINTLVRLFFTDTVTENHQESSTEEES